MIREEAIVDDGVAATEDELSRQVRRIKAMMQSGVGSDQLPIEGFDKGSNCVPPGVVTVSQNTRISNQLHRVVGETSLDNAPAYSTDGTDPIPGHWIPLEQVTSPTWPHSDSGCTIDFEARPGVITGSMTINPERRGVYAGPISGSHTYDKTTGLKDYFEIAVAVDGHICSDEPRIYSGRTIETVHFVARHGGGPCKIQGMIRFAFRSHIGDYSSGTGSNLTAYPDLNIDNVSLSFINREL